MNRTTKIYFDARMIDHPGIGRYIKCLLPFLVEDKELDLHVLGNKEKIKKFLGIESGVINFDYPIYSLQEQFGFIKLKKIVKNNILHVPHYNIPVLAKFNLVVTIHDLIHILYPAGASGRLAPLYMKFMMSRIVKTAKGIICVSGSTKKSIEKMFQKKWDSPNQCDIGVMGQSLFFPGATMEVIYEGVDKAFGKINDATYLKSIKDKYKLPDKFILYVGSIRRHKNISTLLSVFGCFRKKNADVNLVMVGRYGQDIDITKDGVIYLGEIESDKELAAIYNLASCLFNLSLYEGFGLTILEAQACGLPVVCSDIPVHREIGGEGILPVKASYIDQIDENLYNVMFNNNIRDTLIAKGLENTKRFNWPDTAKRTLELYKIVYDESSDSSRLAPGHEGRGKNPKCFLQNISSG